MTISAISSGTSSIQGLYQLDDGDADDIQQPTGATASATQTSISREGGLFGQLSSLAQSNPTEFKQVAGEIADKLKAEAGQATGNQATFLGNLADKFSQAAQTGDLSALKPQGAGGQHHGHHHHHHASSGSSSGQAGGDSIMQIIQQAIQDVTGSSGASTGSTT